LADWTTPERKLRFEFENGGDRLDRVDDRRPGLRLEVPYPVSQAAQAQLFHP